VVSVFGGSKALLSKIRLKGGKKLESGIIITGKGNAKRRREHISRQAAFRMQK
jgi:hypothetical protein